MRQFCLVALTLSGAVSAALPAIAQGLKPKAFVLPLETTVLDIVPTVQAMAEKTSKISPEVQETLRRSGDIEVRQSGEDIILSVASDVLFAFDSAELSQQAKSSLKDVVEVVMRASDGQVRVVGHTDSEGSDDYNLDLSERRAKAVASFLTQHGVGADRLDIEGRGEAEPVAKNEIDGQDNPAGRSKNRRVEFILPRSLVQE